MKPENKVVLQASKWALAAGLVAGLTACGGGSSSSSQLTITGTAATGKALAGATVSVTCATGTGTAVADGNGAYSVSITNGTGPCLLTATQGTTVLHSVAPGAGVINITPLTDMLTTYLAAQAGTTPANLLATANGKAILQSNAAVQAGENAVASVMQTDFGVTLSSSSFLNAAITPAATGVTGSQTDNDLENLLKAGAVTTTGSVQPTASTVVSQVAQQAPPFVAPTGA